jgi:hypothetical protein
MAQGCRHHNRIDDVRRSGYTQQPSCLVRIAFAESNDHASGQEASQLRLLRGPAHLGNYRRWN